MGRGFHINGRDINNLFFLWIFWVEEKKNLTERMINRKSSIMFLSIIYKLFTSSCYRVFFWEGWESFFFQARKKSVERKIQKRDERRILGMETQFSETNIQSKRKENRKKKKNQTVRVHVWFM